MAMRTGISSPFFTSAGTCTRATIALLSGRVETSGLGDDHRRGRSPVRTVGHLGDHEKALLTVQAHAGRDLGAAVERVQMIGRNHRPRVLFREHVDGLYVIAIGHRALDGDLERHRMAVVAERWY